MIAGLVEVRVTCACFLDRANWGTRRGGVVHSHAFLLSKLLRQMAKACTADIGYW